MMPCGPPFQIENGDVARAHAERGTNDSSAKDCVQLFVKNV
jgi:hypothetical protein